MPALDELTEFVVAVNQSLAVMSRAGTPIAGLRAVVRIACSAVGSVLSSSPPMPAPRYSNSDEWAHGAEVSRRASDDCVRRLRTL